MEFGSSQPTDGLGIPAFVECSKKNFYIIADWTSVVHGRFHQLLN